MSDLTKWLRENISWLAVVGSILVTATMAYTRMGTMQVSMDKMQETVEWNRQQTGQLIVIVTGALGVQQRLSEHNDEIHQLDARVRELEKER